MPGTAPQPIETKTPSVNWGDCLAEILSPLATNYGFRHLWIGYTGSGKSNNNVLLVREAARMHRWAIVTDQKNRETAYHGAEIPSFGALAAIDKGNTAIIRGPRMTKDTSDLIDFDELGKGVWDLSQTDEGVLLAIDELSDACEGERAWVKGPLAKRSYMKLLYTQGRTNKISLAAATQQVQEIPRQAIANSDTLGIFCQDRKELAYYRTTNFLDDSECETVASLPKYHFLFIRRGYPSRICIAPEA